MQANHTSFSYDGLILSDSSDGVFVGHPDQKGLAQPFSLSIHQTSQRS
jgi:hypothetical protein